jgi:two-component system OmpR family sensor kinase
MPVRPMTGAAVPARPGTRRIRTLLRMTWPLRTLRGRLIAGLLALLAIGCATVGLITYLAVQGSLSGELGRQLQTATSLANQCLDAQLTGTGIDGDGDDQSQNSQRSSSSSGDAVQGRGGVPISMSQCTGLGPGTLLGYKTGGSSTWRANVVPSDKTFVLSSADMRTLNSIEPVAPASLVHTWTRDLASAGGEFELTVVTDPNGTYVTGVPLSTLHDTLRDLARDEALVFGAVLVLAGAGGTLWVRFALRPLNRVAATASQVAELPLESGEVELPGGVPDTDPGTETGQLGLAFNRMLGHVQNALMRRAASESRLRRFAADASHELRTPLAAIRGYAELALRHPGDAPEPVTHALGRVLSEATRMSVLVDDLLLLARLDAGRPLSTGPVDMSRLAIDATSDAQVARRGHRWVLELPDEPMLVRGDEHRLHQVLVNVLSNAGRHTPDGTTVTVRVSDKLPAGEPGGGPGSVSRGSLPVGPRVVLTVTDNGPGIPDTLLPELFERFTRADTSRSHAVNASSTGLGLAIVDAVIAAHDAAVLVTSHEGMTRFSFVFARLAEPAAAQAQRRPSSAHHG